jgi:hypothetical protein
MYWEAGGHPPGTFLTPHFDFHFYAIGSAERSAIDCVDLSKPAELPAGYAFSDIQLPPPIPATELASTEQFHAWMVVG